MEADILIPLNVRNTNVLKPLPYSNLMQFVPTTMDSSKGYPGVFGMSGVMDLNNMPVRPYRGPNPVMANDTPSDTGKE